MIKKKLMQNMTVFLICVLLLCHSVLAVCAVTHTIDNDDAHGHSNSSNGFSSYLTSSYHYNGDARRQSSSSPSNGLYRWIYKSTFIKSGTINATVKAYLNDYSFTDPAARYYINYGNTYVVKLAGTLNQNTAPGGWNTIGSISMAPIDSSGRNVSSYVQLSVSGKSGYNTGADGIQITLS